MKKGRDMLKFTEVQPGDYVTVLAGAPISSMHPNKKNYKTVRKQVVLVKHVTCGAGYLVGLSRDEGSTFEVVSDHLKRFPSLKEFLHRDLDYNHFKALLPQDSLLRDKERLYCYPSQKEVVWSGSSGYWNSTSISFVEKM